MVPLTLPYFHFWILSECTFYSWGLFISTKKEKNKHLNPWSSCSCHCNTSNQYCSSAGETYITYTYHNVTKTIWVPYDWPLANSELMKISLLTYLYLQLVLWNYCSTKETCIKMKLSLIRISTQEFSKVIIINTGHFAHWRRLDILQNRWVLKLKLAQKLTANRPICWI